MKRTLSAAKRGLTLIELVVVLAILATLAAIVVPRLDFLKEQADHATAASTITDLNTMLQTHKTANGSFPALDLLVDTSGAAYSQLFKATSAPITATTLPAYGGPGTFPWYRSFSEAGLLYGLRHTPYVAGNNASDSASAVANIASEVAEGTLTVAELNYTAPYVSDIVKAVFPGGVARVSTAVGPDTLPNTQDDTYEWQQQAAGTVPAGVKLIAMGIGPKNGMIGNTMSTTPLETGTDDPMKTYCRYIAIFAIYQSGKSAQLKMVVDHRFKQSGVRADQYKSSAATGI